MFSSITQSPALVRVVPFALFLTLTFLQDQFGEAARYWIYVAKTLVSAAVLLSIFRHIREMKWCLSWEAVLTGIAVFVLWVGLDTLVARIGLVPFHNLKVSRAPSLPGHARAMPSNWSKARHVRLALPVREHQSAVFRNPLRHEKFLLRANVKTSADRE